MCGACPRAYVGGQVPNPATNGHFASVHQATGMVSAQLDCDVVEAFARLKLRAAGTHQSVEAIAVSVLDGRIRFDK